MNRQIKSVTRKRNSVIDEEPRQKKRVCIEDFFVETQKPEITLERFQSQMRKLEEEVTLENLKNANRAIQQLKKYNLEENATGNNFMKIIKNLKFFLRNDYVRDLVLNGEGDDAKLKPDVEVIFEACLICFFLLNNRKFLDSDVSDYLNDVVFFWRKMFDNLNSQLSKTKIIRNARLKQLLTDSMHGINELIETCNFNLLNQSELIKSFIFTVFHHTDYDIQMCALSAIKLFYKKGEEFRALIVNLTFSSVGSINDSYKFRKIYKIHDSLYVSMFTILILSLIENVPVFGLQAPEMRDASTMENVRRLLQESYENVMKTACFIIATFIKKRETTVENKTYNICFVQLISEVIEMCNEPEWPSARLILNLLLKPLTDILGRKTESHIPLTMFAIKSLYEVIKKKICDKNNFEKALGTLRVKFQSHRHECDFPEYLQKMLLGYLNKRMGNSKFIHAMQWYESIRNEIDFDSKMLKLVRIMADYTAAEDAADPGEDEHAEMRAIVYYLDTVRRNYTDHRVILKYLLLSCNDKVKKIKTLAIRCILELTTLDIELLSHGTLLKIVFENLPYFPTVNKKLCWLINDHLTNVPDISEEYAPLLLRLSDIPSDDGKRICIHLVMKAIKKGLKLELKTALVYRVLAWIRDENPVTRRQALDFCTELWLGESRENTDVLFAIVEIPNASKYLWLFFEMKLKSPSVPIAAGTPAVDSCSALVEQLLANVERDERTLQCLQIISIIVTVNPKALASHPFPVASPLTRSKYSRDYSVEILSAEIMNRILPEVVAEDVHRFVSLRRELVRKLSSPESCNYSMGFIVSLLKLLNNLAGSDSAFLFENCFEPSVKVLREYDEIGREDNRIISKALCTVIYLHIRFPEESERLDFPALLHYFIRHRVFGLTTIHCLCYLSMDYKLIMKNETVLVVINKYLKDKRYPLLVKAVLYNILCSLKNISNGRMVGSARSPNDSLDPVRDLLRNSITDILDCTIDERSQIRQTAYAVVKQILVSGLIPESRLIPSLLLMSTDPIESLAGLGIEAMRQIPVKKLFEFTRNSSKCMIASLLFNLKCSKKSVIRGYRARENGKMEALCNTFYVVHQEDVAMRRQVIDSVLKELGPEARTNAVEKLFLADNLLTFVYKYQEEVYYVLCQIETVLASVKMPELPERDTNAFVDRYYGAFILTFIKSSLMSYYHFNNDKLRKYYQEDGKKDLVNTNKVFVFDIPESSLPQGDKATNLAKIIGDTLKNQSRPSHT